MKEKIKALFEKIKTQVLSKIPFAKFQAAQNAGGRVIKKLQMPLLLSVGFVALVVGGFVFWVSNQPLEPLRDYMVHRLEKDLNASSAKIGSLKWEFHPLSLSFGVLFEDVELKDAREVEEFRTEKMRISFGLINLLRGGLNLDVRVPQSAMRLGPKAVEKSQAPAIPEPPVRSRLLEFVLSRLSGVRLHLEGADIEVEPSLVSLNEGEAYILFEKIKGQVQMGRGPFYVSLEGDTDVSIQKKFRMLGPLEISAEGYSQSGEGRTVGLKLEKLRVDLKDVDMKALDFLSKPAGTSLEIVSKAQVLFDPSGAIDSVDLSSGKFIYLPVEIGFTAALTGRGKTLGIEWGYGPISVDNFFLPLKGLETLGLNGNFETAGRLRWKHPNPVELTWKLNFNNFVVDLERLHGPLDPASKGFVHLSVVSEGSLEEGHVRSPRTEVQVQGTDAQIVLARKHFVKPAGDPFTLLAKISCEMDNYSLESLSLNANNMQLEAKGSFLNQYPNKLKLEYRTNTIDLMRWSSYVPWFRKIPLQGSIESAGSLEGIVDLEKSDFSQLNWRLDRLNIARARGSFDRESFLGMGYQPQDLSMNGPFGLDFNFQGRGRGGKVSRAQVQARLDLSDVGLILRSRLKKPPGVPLFFNLRADQMDNRLNIRTGDFKFNDFTLDFSGTVQQGSKTMAIPIRAPHPIDLLSWREFFVNLDPRVPLSGKISLEGRLHFPKSLSMEGALDWSRFGFTGGLDLKDLGGVWPPLNQPLKKINGRVNFSQKGLDGDPLLLTLGNSPVRLKFTAKPVKNESGGGLGLLWGWTGSWNVATELSAEKLKIEDLQVGVSPANPSFGEWLKQALDRGDLFNSARSFDFNLKNFDLEKGLTVQNFKGHLSVEKQNLRLEPVSFNMGTGRVEGSLLIDTRPYLSRKDLPQLTLGWILRDVPSDNLLPRAFWKAWEGARLSGEINLSSKGFEVADLRAGLKGRFFGRLYGLQDSSFVPVGSQLGELFSDAAGSSFLSAESRFAQCATSLANAELDVQLGPQKTEVALAELVFKSGSRMTLDGEIRPPQGFVGRGHFWPSPTCVSGGLRDCLLSKNDKGPALNVQGEAGQMKFSFADPDLGSSVLDCRMKRAQASAESRTGRPAWTQKDREQVKKMFQGSGSAKDSAR